MLVGLDATPLVGRQTGVGRYVANLVPHLARLDDVRLVLVPFTLRGRRQISQVSTATIRHRPTPARLLRAAWRRTDFPPVEWFAGRCDVFHGTNFVLPPRKRAAGVVTIHDLSYLRFPETVTPDVRQYRELIPRALNSGAVVVTPSRAVADEVRETYGLPEDRVYVTPLGVGEEWFTAEPPDDRLQHKHVLPHKYLVIVGAKERRKNLSMLLTAHASTVAQDPQALPLIVVGERDGHNAPSLPHKAHVLGHLADEDLRSIVAGASALVVPSSYEGFGLPVLEALATGIPVLTSDIPVFREVAGDQATYVPFDDIDAWAEALTSAGQTLAGSPAGRRKRAKQFTWSRCAIATLDAYEAALSMSAQKSADV
jgi:glycosyltransferase involved in cell wall biosynthesis